MGLFVEMCPKKADRIKNYVEDLGYAVTFVDPSFMQDKSKVGVYKGTLNIYSKAKSKEAEALRNVHETDGMRIKKALNKVDGYLHHIKGTYGDDDLTDYSTVKHLLHNIKQALETKKHG